MAEDKKAEETNKAAEEAKKPEAEAKEAPKAEAKKEAKKEEAPKAEAKAEAKKEEAPKAEAKAEDKKPAKEAPKAEAKADDKKPEAKGDNRGPRAGGPGGQRGGKGGPGGQRGGKGAHGGQRGGRGRGARGADKDAASEFTEKVVQVRRVTKVVKGGKKLSFRAVVVIGNEKGKVGVGVGKASEVINAIKKAVTEARKSLVDVKMLGSTIPHTITGIAGGAKVMLKPAADGTGLIAGGAARTVLELAGLGDVLSKSKGSRSPLNVARATLNGLQSITTFKEICAKRGLTMKQLLHG